MKASTKRAVPPAAMALRKLELRIRRKPTAAARLSRDLARVVEQLRHAADLAEASTPRSPGRAAGHVVAILDDLHRELSVLRSSAGRPA